MTADIEQPALDAASQAAQSGNFREAVAILMRANRQHRSGRLEQEILNYRIRGAEGRSTAEVAWDTHHDGRFEDTEGLPQIAAADLSVDALRAGILGKGGLIVRGLLNEERIEEAKHCIRSALLARKEASEAGEDTGNPWYQRPESVAGGPVQFGSIGKNQYTDTGSVWAVDSPPAAFSLIELYKQLGLPDLLQGYFGEEALLSVRKWVLRCVPPNNGAESGWHQDGQFMGDGIRTVNLWIALSDCGEGADAPGIDIVADNTREIYETGTQGAVFDWTVGQGLVDEIGKTHPVQRPHFQPGDAVFFDHFNLHRTGFGLSDVNLRYAVESWFFASSLAPAKQQPLLF